MSAALHDTVAKGATAVPSRNAPTVEDDPHRKGRVGAGAVPASSMAVLARLLRLGAPQWRRLALASGFGVAAAAASVGLLAGSGYVVGRATFRPGLGAIAGVLAIVEVMAFVRAPLRYGERLAAHEAALRALVHWRVWLYDRLEPLAPAALGGWRSGDLLTRAIHDVDALQDLYVRGLVPAVTAVTASLLAITVVAVLVPAGGLVLGACLLVALVLPAALALGTGSADEREAALRGELGADVVDLVQSVPELVAFGRADDALARIADTDRSLRRMEARRAMRGSIASAVVALSAGGAVVGVLVAAIAAVHRHQLNVDLVAVLPLAAIAAFETVPPVMQAAHRVGSLVAAGRRLLALEDVIPPVTDPGHPTPVPSTSLGIDFADARLRYDEDLPWALDGLSLALPAGRRLALVGPSGSGKSSVVNVLLRFWELQQGRAALGNVPLDDLAQTDVRSTIALVEQDARLFSGTIRHNVTLGRPDADDDDVRRAVHHAQLDEWTETLQQGLDTQVGENGQQVSGGQRQRIALARALVAGGRVIVLDEPTSGLDERTATALMRDVVAATQDRTALLITHDDAEANAFGPRVVIADGRVVSRVSPERETGAADVPPNTDQSAASGESGEPAASDGPAAPAESGHPIESADS